MGFLATRAGVRTMLIGIKVYTVLTATCEAGNTN